MFIFNIYLDNKKKLFNFGNILSKIFFPKFIIFTLGNLGLGKTSLAKSFIGKFFNYRYHIKSPTYSVVETYLLFNIYIHHFDFYRVLNFNELSNIDLFNYLNDNVLLFIEWGDNFIYKFFMPRICIFFFNFSTFYDRFFFFKSDFINFYELFKR